MRLTAKLLLPLHLREQAVSAAEEITHFAVLVVTLGCHVDAVPRLVRQILADLRDRKHDLLQRPVVPHDLDLPRVRCIVVECRINPQLAVTVHLHWTQLFC